MEYKNYRRLVIK